MYITCEKGSDDANMGVDIGRLPALGHDKSCQKCPLKQWRQLALNEQLTNSLQGPYTGLYYNAL